MRSGNPIITYQSQTIGTTEVPYAGGDGFQLLSSPIALTVQLYDDQNQPIGRAFVVQPGKGFEFENVSDNDPPAFFTIGLKAASSVSVDFAVTRGAQMTNNQQLPVAGQGMKGGAGGGGDAYADWAGTNGQIAANSNRRDLIVRIGTDSTADAVFWFDCGAAASHGVPLYRGETLILRNYKGYLNWNATGTNCYVGVTEVLY